ncbi:MAG: phosphatase PAP2 family protein [Acidimicrobiia bacterium]|nr:phosphatase PAP2 family protein [Acidimicrobiia bacterium]
MLVNHRRVGRFALVALLGGVVMLALVAWDTTFPAVQEVDDAWNRLMTSLRVTPLVWLAEFFAFVGGVWINWPLRVAAMAILAVRRNWVQLGAFVLAIVTSEALIGPLKALYARPRPPQGILETTSYSFPSGHAIAGAVTAVGLVIVLLPPGSKRWTWEVRAAIFASLMALSRTYLSVHWLSDVVTGALLGVGLALGWPALFQELRDVRLPRYRAQKRARSGEVSS